MRRGLTHRPPKQNGWRIRLVPDRQVNVVLRSPRHEELVDADRGCPACERAVEVDGPFAGSGDSRRLRRTICGRNLHRIDTDVALRGVAQPQGQGDRVPTSQRATPGCGRYAVHHTIQLDRDPCAEGSRLPDRHRRQRGGRLRRDGGQVKSPRRRSARRRLPGRACRCGSRCPRPGRLRRGTAGRGRRRVVAAGIVTARRQRQGQDKSGTAGPDGLGASWEPALLHRPHVPRSLRPRPRISSGSVDNGRQPAVDSGSTACTVSAGYTPGADRSPEVIPRRRPDGCRWPRTPSWTRRSHSASYRAATSSQS